MELRVEITIDNYFRIEQIFKNDPNLLQLSIQNNRNADEYIFELCREDLERLHNVIGSALSGEK